MNNCETKTGQSLAEKDESTGPPTLKKKTRNSCETRDKPLSAAVLRCEVCVWRMTREKFVICALENCRNETVRRWLTDSSDSDAFFQLMDMFHFLKKHINEEEKKNHSDNVDIIFLAHGAIRDSMLPACCLLPLSPVKDVILYSPWNCVISAEVAYGVATGLLKPQHRVFYCMAEGSSKILDEEFCPKKLPQYWNSMKNTGDQTIPNITLSPVKALDGYWPRFQHLILKYGQPERDRIIIPYILTGNSSSSESVPFFVVTLALSLVLLSSRFQATIHLPTCLSDQSTRKKLDHQYLQQQYACTINKTYMTCSPNIFGDS